MDNLLGDMKVNVTRGKLVSILQKSVTISKLNVKAMEVVDTILEKNAEYGDSWQRFAIFTPLIRIREKIVRLTSLADKRLALVYDPDIDEELTDIIAYALLAKLWLSENDVEEMIVEEVQELHDHILSDEIFKGYKGLK